MTTNEQLIDLVIDRAPKLREAGVLELSIDGVTVKLQPFEPEVGAEAAVEPETSNAWTDPDLYGRGTVPGRNDKAKKGADR